MSNNQTLTFTVNADRTLVAQFAEHTGSNFDNVMIGSTPWNQNGQSIGTSKISGSYVGNRSQVALINQQPTVGKSYQAVDHKSVTNHAFSDLDAPAKGTYWLVAGNWDEDGEIFYVYDIYEYTATKS